MVDMGHSLDVPSPERGRWSTSTIPPPWSLGGIASSGHPGLAGSGHHGSPRGIRYWFEDAASHDAADPLDGRAAHWLVKSVTGWVAGASVIVVPVRPAVR
jgi:hypothetical protein